MSKNKISSLKELGKILLKNEIVFEQFIQEVTVAVTEMFRDPDFYKTIRQKVIQHLSTYPFLKIWIAGCATGEEVYSVAILLKEEGLLDRSVIYATDINQKSLQAAKKGVFPMNFMKTYTANYQKSFGENSFSNYYHSKFDSILMDKSLKQNIVFSVHNLVTDQSFNEFQLIFCRNVLIYFNRELQNKVIDLFHKSLCNFGFLGLGSKDINHFEEAGNKFKIVDKEQRIFMKNG